MQKNRRNLQYLIRMCPWICSRRTRCDSGCDRSLQHRSTAVRCLYNCHRRGRATIHEISSWMLLQCSCHYHSFAMLASHEWQSSHACLQACLGCRRRLMSASVGPITCAGSECSDVEPLADVCELHMRTLTAFLTLQCRSTLSLRAYGRHRTSGSRILTYRCLCSWSHVSQPCGERCKTISKTIPSSTRASRLC